MILLSGITDSAVGTMFAIIFILTLLTYGILYWILTRFEDIKDFFKRLRETKVVLFYLSHVLLYFISLLLLILGFRFYLDH